jgi:hypothetical protein
LIRRLLCGYRSGVRASSVVDDWLDRFALDDFLRPHVGMVVTGLPAHVRSDLLDDPAFHLSDYEPGGVAFEVPVAAPRGRRPSRAVVLKRTLRHRPVPFIQWVIAHELAHAHLRNAGRFPGEDPEHAADALAAEWGFPRPPREQWGTWGWR